MSYLSSIGVESYHARHSYTQETRAINSAREHTYSTNLTWTGNKGQGTSAYDAYARDYEVACAGKTTILGSADATYLGDTERHNPEEMLVSALSACHMLWYLHLCAVKGVVVTAYEDTAEGQIQTHADGSGEFKQVTLRPRVTISASSDPDEARRLHDEANAMCFIARSVNFPVHHRPKIQTG